MATKPRKAVSLLNTGSGGRNTMVGGGGGVAADRSRDTTTPESGFFVVDPMGEVGTSGLKRARGILLEESFRELRGRLGVRAYRELYDNSTVIGGALLLYHLILRQVKQNILPKEEGDPECEKWAQFCAECCEDMDHRFDDVLTESYTMLRYGWAYAEQVFKYRLGPDPGYVMGDDGKPKLDRYGNPELIPPSKFSDGMVGWKRIAFRAQETLQEWKFGPQGQILGMLQNDPWSGMASMRYLPIEKCILFRTESIKNNPEGRSLLRPAWALWRIVKRIQEAEAVGVTRDITGMPKIRVPPEAMLQSPKPNDAAVRSAAERMGTALAMHEEMMVLLPALYDKSGKPLHDVELMGTSGHRLWDTDKILTRLEARMLTSILMQFLVLGQGTGTRGSWALSDDQSDATVMAINAIAEAATDVFTEVAFPLLVKLNGGDPTKAPEMKATPVKKIPNMREMAEYLRALGTMGVGLVEPGSDLEKALLMFGGLPVAKATAAGGAGGGGQQPPPKKGKKGAPPAPAEGSPTSGGPAPGAPGGTPPAGPPKGKSGRDPKAREQV